MHDNLPTAPNKFLAHVHDFGVLPFPSISFISTPQEHFLAQGAVAVDLYAGP